MGKLQAKSSPSWRISANGKEKQEAQISPSLRLGAGTSETIIKKHYKGPVMLEDAERFFSIRPHGEAEKKIAIA